jgi:hypothetical protein
MYDFITDFSGESTVKFQLAICVLDTPALFPPSGEHGVTDMKYKFCTSLITASELLVIDFSQSAK